MKIQRLFKNLFKRNAQNKAKWRKYVSEGKFKQLEDETATLKGKINQIYGIIRIQKHVLAKRWTLYRTDSPNKYK